MAVIKSIIQNERECFLCGREEPLELHHCIEGSYRRISDRYGLVLWLCTEHHMRTHESEEAMQFLRKKAQQAAMDHYGWSVEEFIDRFGRNFL